jgi:membrane protease YdiL (CAAX protease family)
MTSRKPAIAGASPVAPAAAPDATRALATALVVAFLLAGTAGAVALRVVMLRPPSAPGPQAIAFGGVLLLLAFTAGSRIPSLSIRVIATGIIGGAILVLIPLGLGLATQGGWTGPVVSMTGGMAAFDWMAVTLIVACGEEALLRGALFRVCLPPLGALGTVLLTSVVFALIHLPFYGWPALPLDFAVGVWLGGLRLASGSAAAPAIAHSVADLAAWWL